MPCVMLDADRNPPRRGVPVDRYSREETMVAYWGIGLYLGRANAQNRKAHLIGHIKVLLSVLLCQSFRSRQVPAAAQT